MSGRDCSTCGAVSLRSCTCINEDLVVSVRKAKPNVFHSSRSDNWHTPREYVEAVRAVFGGVIDLDPASSAQANSVVRATSYWTESDDGLSKPCWYGNVYLNPPGGKRGNRSLAGLFWSKLMEQRSVLGQAIYMGFSAEHMQSTQKPGQRSILDFPFCVPAKRIRFVDPTGLKSSPSHSNVIAYVPGIVDNTDKFLEVFARFGKVRR